MNYYKAQIEKQLEIIRDEIKHKTFWERETRIKTLTQELQLPQTINGEDSYFFCVAKSLKEANQKIRELEQQAALLEKIAANAEYYEAKGFGVK